MSISVFLKEYQSNPGFQLQENVSMQSLTSFQVGGIADALISIQSPDILPSLMEGLARHAVPWHFIGNGSNILAPDGYFHGALLRLEQADPVVSGNIVYAPAGCLLSKAASFALKSGLQGMEGLSGIPGTIGGAIAMNAGAYGYETKDCLQEVTVLQNGIIRSFSVNKGDFSYRSSPYAAPESIVLSASFLLSPDDGGAAERTRDFQARRREKQPLTFPSAGSTFKRPAGHFAGALIEQCGLKGCSIGGAQVSEKHAGFIINKGGATCSDVLSLIEHVQGVVLKETGVYLEREVKLLSEV